MLQKVMDAVGEIIELLPAYVQPLILTSEMIKLRIRQSLGRPGALVILYQMMDRWQVGQIHSSIIP